MVLQETRGIRTAYVLKKGKDYVGCRTESLSKEETCYIMELITTKWKLLLSVVLSLNTNWTHPYCFIKLYVDTRNNNNFWVNVICSLYDH